jgi:hypothetical protein
LKAIVLEIEERRLKSRISCVKKNAAWLQIGSESVQVRNNVMAFLEGLLQLRALTFAGQMEMQI